MEKDAQESQASQRIQWNISHRKQQTIHITTLFYQNFWADSWTESKNATKAFHFLMLLKQGGDFRSTKHSIYWTQWSSEQFCCLLYLFLNITALKDYNPTSLLSQLQTGLSGLPSISKMQSSTAWRIHHPSSHTAEQQRDAAPQSADGLLQFWGQEFGGKWTAVMFYSKTSNRKTSDSAADSRWLRCPGMGRGWGGQMGPVMPSMLRYPHCESELWHESCCFVSTEFCTLHHFCSTLCASCILQTDETEIWCCQQRREQLPPHYHQKRITVVLDLH